MDSQEESVQHLALCLRVPAKILKPNRIITRHISSDATYLGKSRVMKQNEWRMDLLTVLKQRQTEACRRHMCAKMFNAAKDRAQMKREALQPFVSSLLFQSDHRGSCVALSLLLRVKGVNGG